MTDYEFVDFNQDDEAETPKKQPVGGKGFAVASLILGISGIVLACLCCCFFYISILPAALAIIFAFLSRNANGKKFRGMALAGLILGIVAVIIFATLLGLTLFGNSITDMDRAEIESILREKGMDPDDFFEVYDQIAGESFYDFDD